MRNPFRTATTTDPTLTQILSGVNEINAKVDITMAVQDDINAAVQAIQASQAALTSAVAAIQTAVADIKAWEQQAGPLINTTDLDSAVTALNSATASVTAEVADVQSADLLNPPPASAEPIEPEAPSA